MDVDQIEDGIMECFRCKRLIADDSMFCNFCGSKQEKTQELSTDEMIDRIQEKLSSVTGYSFNETGRLKCEKWMVDFGF